MGVLFESILLFSLAVLIIVMGLLVYYFKKRIVEVEQQNASCLEIVQDVYTQHMKLRNEVYSVMAYQSHDEHVNMPQMVYRNEEDRDDRIKIVLSEDEDEEEDEDEDDEDDDDEAKAKDKAKDKDKDKDKDKIEIKNDINDIDEDVQETIKIVSVDLTFDEAVEINVDDEEPEEIEEETELKSLETTDVPIVVNKVGPPQITKEELKKLTPSSLKSLLIGKGFNGEKVSKMKKNELIEKLLEENV